MSNIVFKNLKTMILSGQLDLLNDQINIVLVNNYIFSDSQQKFSDISSFEVSGFGYTSGGIELSNKSVSEISSIISFDANDISFSNVSLTATGAIIIKKESNLQDSELLGYYDFFGSKTVSGGNFNIQWSTLGILRIL